MIYQKTLLPVDLYFRLFQSLLSFSVFRLSRLQALRSINLLFNHVACQFCHPLKSTRRQRLTKLCFIDLEKQIALKVMFNRFQQQIAWYRRLLSQNVRLLIDLLLSLLSCEKKTLIFIENGNSFAFVQLRENSRNARLLFCQFGCGAAETRFQIYFQPVQCVPQLKPGHSCISQRKRNRRVPHI